MGHAYSVSDWGVKTEREEKERERETERERVRVRESERVRERERGKESKNRGTISMAQGLPGGFTSPKEAQQDQPRSNAT